MEFNHNYITVDNPNIDPALNSNVPLGEMVDTLIAKASQGSSDIPGDIEVKDMYLPHATIRTMQGHFNEDAVFYNKHNTGSHLIASCLFLDGHVRTTLDGKKHGVDMRKGQQTMKYDPNNEYKHWSKAYSPFHIIHFSVDPRFLFDMLPEDEAWSAEVRDRVVQRKRIFGEMPTMITMPQYDGLRNIFDCPVTGKLGLVMRETSLIQILLCQMHAQFQQAEDTQPKIAKRDLEIIQGVKEYLTKTFLEDHSLVCLARQFATNTNKLMLLFKKVYGVSIFEYLGDLKMDYARHLLLDGLYVGEVARNVGYKNAHHFSTAFKKKYGTCPSHLKC